MIDQRLAAEQEFLLLGYSFGGLIALEILKLLEKNNRLGKLWLIDSAPQYLKIIIESANRNDNAQEHEIQVQLILRFFDLVWPNNNANVSFLKYIIFK